MDWQEGERIRVLLLLLDGADIAQIEADAAWLRATDRLAKRHERWLRATDRVVERHERKTRKGTHHAREEARNARRTATGRAT